MANNPLCPDCRKQMTPRFICTHCGYDTQRIQTTTHRKVASTPYNCAKCNSPTGKLVDGIPVCGECFVAGWGRLPSMPLVPSSMEVEGKTLEDFPIIGAPEAPLYVSDKPPKPKKVRRKKQSKHGGTR